MHKEMADHGDVLELALQDTYRHLPRKLLLGLRYAYGQGYDYVMKTDDDVYIHVPR